MTTPVPSGMLRNSTSPRGGRSISTGDEEPESIITVLDWLQASHSKKKVWEPGRSFTGAIPALRRALESVIVPEHAVLVRHHLHRDGDQPAPDTAVKNPRARMQATAAVSAGAEKQCGEAPRPARLKGSRLVWQPAQAEEAPQPPEHRSARRVWKQPRRTDNTPPPRRIRGYNRCSTAGHRASSSFRSLPDDRRSLAHEHTFPLR